MKETHVLNLKSRINSINFSNDYNFLLVGYRNTLFEIYDLRTFELKYSIKTKTKRNNIQYYVKENLLFCHSTNKLTVYSLTNDKFQYVMSYKNFPTQRIIDYEYINSKLFMILRRKVRSVYYPKEFGEEDLSLICSYDSFSMACKAYEKYFNSNFHCEDIYTMQSIENKTYPIFLTTSKGYYIHKFAEHNQTLKISKKMYYEHFTTYLYPYIYILSSNDHLIRFNIIALKKELINVNRLWLFLKQEWIYSSHCFDMYNKNEISLAINGRFFIYNILTETIHIHPFHNIFKDIDLISSSPNYCIVHNHQPNQLIICKK